jgi:hypothetical protein
MDYRAVISGKNMWIYTYVSSKIGIKTKTFFFFKVAQMTKTDGKTDKKEKVWRKKN